MQKSDLKQFKGLINAMCVGFGRECSEPLLEFYLVGLKDLEFPAINRAMQDCIRTGVHMPRPAEIRAAAGFWEVDIDNLALTAWNTLFEQIGRVGSYGDPVLDEVTFSAVQSLGGWAHLCGQTTQQLQNWTKREFERFYVARAGPGAPLRLKGGKPLGLPALTGGAS